MLNWFKSKPVEEKPSKEFKPINGILSSQALIGTLEPNSSTWLFIISYIENRIANLHKRNENVTISVEKAQAIRGGIKELKLLLKQVKDEK